MKKLTFRKCGNACNNENNSSPGRTLCVAQIRFSFSFVPTLTWGKHTNVSFWKENRATLQKKRRKKKFLNIYNFLHTQQFLESSWHVLTSIQITSSIYVQTQEQCNFTRLIWSFGQHCKLKKRSKVAQVYL